MDKRIKRFLWISLILVIFVCSMIFIGLTKYMSVYSEKTIKEASRIYMAEINLQLQQKFDTTINLRLTQISGILQNTLNQDLTYEELIRELTYTTRYQNFTYLAFYTQEGELKTIFGEDVTFADRDHFRESLDEDGNVIERGYTNEGRSILLIGKKAKYPMENGEESEALIAGVSMDYLSDSLYLGTDQDIVYSYIIDKNGEFVTINQNIDENYFDRVRKNYDEYEGVTPEEYLEELQNAIKLKEPYNTVISLNGTARHIYCTPLSGNSDWYLISGMPNGTLENAITSLESARLKSTLISVSAIILLMLFVFIWYFRLSERQMRALHKAQEDAIYANKAKSEFLASMSHDIRTPMNAIIGMTDIAMKNRQDPERVEDCLKKVKLSSKHLLGLINDVLDMSKIESGKMTLNMELLSLRDTMDDIVNIIQPQVKANNRLFDIFIRDIISEEVYCDGVRLNQVLLNLLSNAVKFTRDEGRIDVHVYQEALPGDSENIRTHFIVEDDGIGMSEEFQKNVFDAFTRANSDTVRSITGAGLGMAITKNIVTLMNGTITVESELDKGSKFHVMLDLKKAEEAPEMALPDWNVLVVDDNEQLCLSAVSNLEELGVKADWTTEGKTAVQMVEEHHKNHDDYRFVLVDWKMPNMDGLQTVSEIQKRVGTEIPVFLISAYDWSDLEDQVKSLAIEGFISKPLFKSTLYSCLVKYTEEIIEASTQEEEQVTDFTGKRLLVAEDIDINWEIAEDVLTAFGFELERAVNGKVCVEMYEKSEPGYYDAILMDIRMPVMDGYDATRAIRKLDREDNITIIAMTADAFSNDVQYCLECGMNDHVAKPLDIRILIQVLQKYL